MDARATYPALMAYIDNRNTLASTAAWCNQLRKDEAAAFAGQLADVAAELARAKEDFGAARRAIGRSDYPYNRDMGLFLGLGLKASGDPGPGAGYYMATRIESHHRLGEATRRVQWLIDQRRPLIVVAARSKTDRTPVRFYRFAGPGQVKIEGNEVVASDGKRRVRLASNWSIETAMAKVDRAMSHSHPYGEPGPTPAPAP